MHTHQIVVRATLLIVALSLPMTLAAQVTPASIEIARLDADWAAGQYLEYFQAVDMLADGLLTDEDSMATTKAAQLLATMSSDGRVVPQSVRVAVGTTDLGAMSKLARVILKTSDASAPKNQDQVEALALFLGRTRTERIPRYTWKPVVANVQPPSGVPGGAGMDPAVIADPAARHEYEMRIQQNQLAEVSNSRQATLQSIQAEFTQPVLSSIRELARNRPDAKELLKKVVAEAKLSIEEKGSVGVTSTR